LNKNCFIKAKMSPPQIPTFGACLPGIEYEQRRAAYAVIVNKDGAIAAVNEKNRYFLPGGGLLENESPEETVEREIREELARDIRLVREIGKAIQYFQADGRCYKMHAVFFLAEFAGKKNGKREYSLHWIDAGKTDRKFFHECHSWAVRQV